MPAQVREDADERTKFETELREQGYGEIVDRRMEANTLNPEHAHEFDAHLLVLEGAITITAAGTERIYGAGRYFFDERGPPPQRAQRTRGGAIFGRAALSGPEISSL